jgi:hypothetical protein
MHENQFTIMQLQNKQHFHYYTTTFYLKMRILDLRRVLEYPLTLEVVVVVPPLYCVGVLVRIYDMVESWLIG